MNKQTSQGKTYFYIQGTLVTDQKTEQIVTIKVWGCVTDLVFGFSLLTRLLINLLTYSLRAMGFL